MAVRPVKLLVTVVALAGVLGTVLGGCSGGGGSASSADTLFPGGGPTTTNPAPTGAVYGLVDALRAAGVTLCEFPSGLPDAASTAIGYAINPNKTCRSEAVSHPNLFIFGFSDQEDAAAYLGRTKQLDTEPGTTTTNPDTVIAGWLYQKDVLIISGPVPPATLATAARVFTSKGATNGFSIIAY